jgi:catechol 2,3-dioxygenase-like lactoylglutathione lyase family enzyme
MLRIVLLNRVSQVRILPGAPIERRRFCLCSKGFAIRRPHRCGPVQTPKPRVFHTPTVVSAEPENAPANTLDISRITFAVEDLEDVLARLHTHGAELVGQLEQYEDSYRLCYVRGPEGISVELAEQLS